jgi:hypothetical protein
MSFEALETSFEALKSSFELGLGKKVAGEGDPGWVMGVARPTTWVKLFQNLNCIYLIFVMFPIIESICKH